ncbi:MAG: hypothetical protein NVSMB53_01050 [Gemmatimonadaceae bacterium]
MAMILAVGDQMKVLSRPLVLFCLAVLAGGACRKETKAKEVSSSQQQDTMLLRDLAEANKNTAAAAGLDNSLNTVKTTGNGSLPAASGDTKIAPKPSSSGTSGTRPPVPTKASDAPGPTMVPLDRSPASRSSGDPCNSPAPVDQRSCLNRSIAANDADLNQTYHDLMVQADKSGGAELQDRFRQAQRDWIIQRDSDCTAQTQSQNGRLWARARARCLADYSTKRTAELQKNLNSLRGQ